MFLSQNRTQYCGQFLPNHIMYFELLLVFPLVAILLCGGGAWPLLDSRVSNFTRHIIFHNIYIQNELGAVHCVRSCTIFIHIICPSPKTHKLIRCGSDCGDRNSIYTMSVWKCVGCYLPSLPIGCVLMVAKIHPSPASVLLPLSLHSHSFFVLFFSFSIYLYYYFCVSNIDTGSLNGHVIYTAPHPTWNAQREREMDRNEQRSEKNTYNGIIVPKSVRCEWGERVSSNPPATKTFFRTTTTTTESSKRFSLAILLRQKCVLWTENWMQAPSGRFDALDLKIPAADTFVHFRHDATRCQKSTKGKFVRQKFFFFFVCLINFSWATAEEKWKYGRKKTNDSTRLGKLCVPIKREADARLRRAHIVARCCGNKKGWANRMRRSHNGANNKMYFFSLSFSPYFLRSVEFYHCPSDDRKIYLRVME